MSIQADAQQISHYIELFQHHQGRGEPDTALEYLAKAVDLNPQVLDQSAYENCICYFEAKGHLDALIAWSKRLLAFNPNSISAYEKLASTYGSSGNYAEAQYCYRKILQIDPSLSSFSNQHHVHYGVPSRIVQLEKSASDLAWAFQTTIMQVSHDPAHIKHLHEARSYIMAGRLDAAFGALRAAVDGNSSFLEGEFGIGLILFSMNKVEEARGYFQRVIQQRPEWAESYYYLGRTISTSWRRDHPEDLDEALVYFKTAISLKPDYADAYLECGNAYHYQAKEREGFPFIQKYMELREAAIEAHPLAKLNIRFLNGFGYAMGHLAESPDVLLKLQKIGWSPAKHLVCLFSESQVANPCLLDYWKEHLTVITDPEAIRLLRPLEKILEYDATYARLPDKRIRHVKVVKSALQTQWEAEGRAPLLKVREADIERGRKALERFGVPDSAWFVAVHVREAGFKNEGQTVYNKYRNCDIDSYRAAFKVIVDRGGWVVRMGEASMKPMAPMAGVVDYAHSDEKSDWMDVFLCGACRFYVGTTGGVTALPSVFGTPIISTNYAPTPMLYSVRDLTIPKLLWHTSEKRLLTFKELLSPPILQNEVGDFYQRWNLEFIDNKEDELSAIVSEMLDRLDGTIHYGPKDEELQRRFKELFPRDFGEISPRIGRDFLRKYESLL